MKNKNIVILTRKQFRKFYGKHPDWLWEILKDNYRRMKK